MSATINEFMQSDGEKITYTVSFRRMIEDHLPFLREHETTDTLALRPDVAWRFHGDLTGVLHHYDFRWDLHWIIMRVNNYTSPKEFDYRNNILLVPSSTTVARLIRIHRALKKLEQKEKLTNG